MADFLHAALHLLVFPGFLFLVAYGLACEWLDRKLHARMQNRVGPPLLQPLADLIKLLAKEDLVPVGVQRGLFQVTPAVALAAVMTPIVFVPVWGVKALASMPCDLVVALYFFSLPTFAFFLVGWASGSAYPLVGGFRAITMLFGFEIPLLLCCLSGAVVAGSWTISDIAAYLAHDPVGMLVLAPGFLVALVTLEAKLERPPFDIPHAETEIVAGPLTEVSGRKLAVMRLVADVGMVVGASLLAAVFLGGLVFAPGSLTVSGADLSPWANLGLYFGKTLLIVFLLCVIKTTFARLRIDQVLVFSWRYVATASILQLFLAILYAGVFER